MKGLAGSPRSTDVRHLVFKVLSFHLLLCGTNESIRRERGTIHTFP